MRPPVPTASLSRRPEALRAAAVSLALLALLAAGWIAGTLGALALVAAVLSLGLLTRPGYVAVLTVAAVVACEDAGWGLFPQTAHLYDDLAKGFTPLDALLVLAVLGAAIGLLRDGRAITLGPQPLVLALFLLGLAVISGVVVGRDAGAGLSSELLVLHYTLYLAILPLLVLNLPVARLDMRRLMAGGLVLAGVKACLGLVVVALGRGEVVDGTSSLTYYEPTANWLMTIAVLTIVALVVMRVRAPRWVYGVGPLLALALALSYRRSFWIADALGFLLVLIFGLSPAGRRALVPTAVLIGLAFWVLGAGALQSDTPLGQRLQSLSTSKIEATPVDRYRLDERANVVGELKRHPVTGLGLTIPWAPIVRSLPVESNPDHLYVHFAALYWWLKFGILGLIAYASLIVTGVVLSIRVWRRAPDPVVAAFGLASMCSFIGLVVIETTATFTGVDPRFSVVLGAQLGLLALLARRQAAAPADDQASSVSMALVKPPFAAPPSVSPPK